uniref:BTB domain-containing protein n=1 Tax=Knipowitschia caucasica TaxID=637954 RepID=A0AAV2LEA2_KNICA
MAGLEAQEMPGGSGLLNLEAGEDHEKLVKVWIEECCFQVERTTLAKYSDYFKALFESGMIESHQEEVCLKGGVRPRGFLIALAVCRGELPTLSDPEELIDAIECAAFLQVPMLARHLCDIIDSDNCLLLYYTSYVFGLTPVSHRAAQFLADAFEDLKETAETQLPEELLEYSRTLSPAKYIALGTHTPSMELLNDSFRVVCYLDENEQEWKHLTSLPTLCSTSMAGVAVLDNRLYIVGGVYGYKKDTVDRSFCYDPQSGLWTDLAGPQQPRYNFTLLGHEGSLYAIGGELESRNIATAERYNVKTGLWTFTQAAPRPVGSAACAVTRRRMFVCFWKSPDTTDIYEYLPARDEWKLTTALIKRQSYGHCMVAHRDNLYVMRNGPGDDFLRCLMDSYSITTGQWTAMTGLYINSKGALFTSMVRGDSVFTVKHMLTLEYKITAEDFLRR